MHHAVADGVDPRHVVHDAGVAQRRADRGERRAVVGCGHLPCQALHVPAAGIPRVPQRGCAFADALDAPRGQDRAARHVDQLILERGAARVDDEYFHARVSAHRRWCRRQRQGHRSTAGRLPASNLVWPRRGLRFRLRRRRRAAGPW
ncbi:MAG: hypothetical protein MZV65_18360 [Chromatiales bacterium]|nr:hypothetical protein [Chromatiales bacterium]